MNETTHPQPNLHPYYDHPSQEDTVSALRDALAERGWDVVVAHTGGGCMSVGVVLSEDRYALVGADASHTTPLNDVTCGGADLDVDGEYVGSLSFECDAGVFVDAAEDALRSMRNGDAALR